MKLFDSIRIVWFGDNENDLSVYLLSNGHLGTRVYRYLGLPVTMDNTIREIEDAIARDLPKAEYSYQDAFHHKDISFISFRSVGDGKYDSICSDHSGKAGLYFGGETTMRNLYDEHWG